MQIIDTHVHFWDPDNLSYSWLDNEPILKRSYLPTDYKIAIGEHDVGGIVFVEASIDAGFNIREADWIATLDAPIRAVVAHASLENQDGLAETLETLANKPVVKGIRRIYQDDAVGFAEQPAFIKGVQMLADYDLSFDICIHYQHLPETIHLVQQCPNIRFVLDHIAKPDIAGGEFDTWRDNINKLAQLDNIVCKVSGIITEADHDDWTQEQIKPYILEVISAFGIERLMFGSDWPVVNLAGSFIRWMDALNWVISQLSTDERQKLFVDNATQFYRFD